MQLSEFDYFVPDDLIAQAPLANRQDSKLMVLDRKKQSITHACFKDLPSFLTTNDHLIFNNSKVIPARLLGRRPSGGSVEVFLLRESKSNQWECLLKSSAKEKIGMEINFSQSLRGTILKQMNHSMVYLIQLFSNEGTVREQIENIGKIPLPPYIKREATQEDQNRYQTIYAEQKGSVAAPTAGLHFTPAIFAELEKRNIQKSYITLHVGIGTFLPIKSEKIDDHQMHEEYFSIDNNLKNHLLKKEKSLVAVGTTSVRAIESVANGNEDKTSLFIKPGYQFKLVDKIFTNFHQPKSSLVVMISAFAGKDFLFRAYEEAVKERYRFFSYGDCMLIL
ncbi:MAG: tRNA preQ1(34) S-adenosylmethionine ribosyltransferase-isomerase QueA [Oligoflexia bacterium]|nr:tRNA preQ1(34) S-adenosylmethionine ribosyltransferase-isomerase QueA [Oligoflexia bacterium]